MVNFEISNKVLVLRRILFTTFGRKVIFVLSI